MNVTNSLPPGQQVLAEFPRFGLPQYMQGWPLVPDRPTLTIRGEVGEPCDVKLEELRALPRTEIRADFHCVATWSRLDLSWSGVRFRDFFEQIVLPRSRPRGLWVRFRGLDGFFATLHLDDALAPDVLLADRLDGAPLPLDHGAPLRLLAPAHYGYKSVKHLSAVDVRHSFSPKRFTQLEWTEHPRARVAREERGRGKPGPELRSTYATLLPEILRAYRPSAAPPRPGKGP